jgi:3-oxoacyl-[acyl-carrier-protein] synthase II
MAVRDAGLELASIDLKRVGVSMGTTIGGAGFSYDQHLTLIEKGAMKIHPYTASITWPNACSTWVSMDLKARGPSETVSNACVSSCDAIILGSDLIRSGEMDVVVAGGAESPLFPMFYSAFCLSKIAAGKNNGCVNVPCPFDRRHDGTVLSEGAGLLILEELQHALSRDAFIYGELCGYGVTCDASHMVRPDYKGISRAMQIAITEAGFVPEDIDYVHATGSGTPMGDVTETIALKDALGRHAYRVPVSSIKSMVGHMMGAAGAVELSACLLALMYGVIPPTINYRYPDPDCDLDYVPNRSRVARIHAALTNCFGFGGKNTAVVLTELGAN